MSTTAVAAPTKQPWLDAFERLEREPAAPALSRLRRAAVSHFDAAGFPTPRDEDWKFTNLAPLLKQTFPLAPDGRPQVEVAGPLPAGVVAGSLADALASHPDLVEPHLARLAATRGNFLAALNTAFLRDGAFVYVPPGVVVEAPIHLTFTASAEPHLAWHRRCLVVVGEGAQVTLVERYAGPAETTYFTSAVTEVAVGPGAVVEHCKLQEEGDRAFHLAVTQAVLQRDGRLSTHYLGFGGHLVRNEVRVVFAGEGGEATVNGLYQAGDNQHADNFTVIDHARAHCASHELYKGVLAGKAHGVFNGKIFVRPGAQKTDAKQTNQTLLLSDDATINTKPQLEIYADDVKCTHGATVGQLPEEQLFYLRARGIGPEEARALLTFAFANEVLERVKVESVRRRLEQVLLASRGLPAAETDEDGP